MFAWMASIMAGPLSLGVITASLITLLKALFARSERVALDFLLPGGFIWLLEAVLLISGIIWSVSGNQYFWMFGPSLPVALLLTLLALGILILSAVIIQRRAT